ncbi:hypothetical protein WUBG_18548 [Wuchereria bancrofti]|uniref:Uncharacterized protein n=1 Tax=Wuchereria bancrofti TaxID=6293 RepID=J9E5E6_WUCBA|nr:hypothetical protein WUBG_18548 [Wuchereria bancrofti]
MLCLKLLLLAIFSTEQPILPARLSPFVDAAACKGCVPPCICPGRKGERGIPGFQGERGHPGAPGQDGGEGQAGAGGMQGAEGDFGDPGMKGARGDRGFYICDIMLCLKLLLLAIFSTEQPILPARLSPFVDAAACKGCVPPCICPGRKGERVLPFLI